MNEFGERLRAFRTRFGLADRTTAITAASVVIVLALIAVPLQSDSDGARTAGDFTQRAAEAAEEGIDLGSGPTTDEAPGGAETDRSSSRGSTTPGARVEGPDTPDAKAPPITATTMKVGIPYTEDPSTAQDAAGFSEIGQVDQRRGWDAVIKEFNKNPPFGRKIVPVYFPVTTEEVTSKGGERMEQEACAHWTQDNRVFMVWEWSVAGEILDACMTKNRIPSVTSGAGDSSVFEKNPYKVAPTAIAMDRMARIQVEQLYKQGFFSKFKQNSLPYTPQIPADKKPRIGLIRYDQPAYKVSAAVMKQELAKHGLALCDGCEFEIAYSDDNAQEQLDDATEVNAAIQNFKSKGVTHVMFLGTTAGVRITLFFIDGAEKQQYRPRLGFNPEDAPYAVRDFLKDASYPQFRDSLYVSDTPAGFGTRPPSYATCKKTWEDAGESFEDDDTGNKQNQIPFYCDPAWYTKAVMLKVGRDLNLRSWMDAVHKMDAVPSASVYRMQTKLGRHDGSGAIRVGPWVDDCACWKPNTPVILV